MVACNFMIPRSYKMSQLLRMRENYSQGGWQGEYPSGFTAFRHGETAR